MTCKIVIIINHILQALWLPIQQTAIDHINHILQAPQISQLHAPPAFTLMSSQHLQDSIPGCSPSCLDGCFKRKGEGKRKIQFGCCCQGKVHRKKVKKKLTSVSFMYVCVAENVELLFFFYFFLHFPHRQFSFIDICLSSKMY